MPRFTPRTGKAAVPDRHLRSAQGLQVDDFSSYHFPSMDNTPALYKLERTLYAGETWAAGVCAWALMLVMLLSIEILSEDEGKQFFLF